MRFLLVAALCLFSLPAKAATYFVDASIGGTNTGNIGIRWYETPVYHFQPGDIVDFGSVQIYPYSSAMAGNFFYQTGGFGVAYNGSYLVPHGTTYYICTDLFGPPGCSGAPFQPPLDQRLLFTIPDDASSIQLAWTIPSAYQAVPEPSTWAMLLLGFAGIGFMTWRRRYCMASVR